MNKNVKKMIKKNRFQKIVIRIGKNVKISNKKLILVLINNENFSNMI